MGAIKGVIAWVKAQIARLRAGRPFVDHVFQMLSRYSAENGSRLVSAITVPAFLAFFPLIALALSVAGYVAHYDHGAQEQIRTAIEGYFPGLGLGDLVDSISTHRTSTGVIGLVGLLFSGLGLVSTLRSALRTLWHLDPGAGNFLLSRVRDAGVLVALGVAFLLSLAVSNVATTATTVIADHVPFLDGGATEVLLRVVGIAVAVGVNVLLFVAAFRLLPQTGAVAIRDYFSGALFAAIGFEIVQVFGSVYLTRTTSNPLYGTIAIAVGLLVATNLLSQVFVLAAAWAVTGPYAPDVAPSGTATGPAGVPALALPGARSRVPHERVAAGAGTAVFGGLLGLAAVIGVRAVRSVLPRD